MESIPMPEVTNGIRASIPEHLMFSRLAQSEQMREFFIQMWIKNLALARQAGSRIQALLSPLATNHDGIFSSSSSIGNDGGGEK